MKAGETVGIPCIHCGRPPARHTKTWPGGFCTRCATHPEDHVYYQSPSGKFRLRLVQQRALWSTDRLAADMQVHNTWQPMDNRPCWLAGWAELARDLMTHLAKETVYAPAQ